MPTIGVLLCDDAEAFSVLFEHWMTECPDVEVVGIAGTPDEAGRLAGEHQPDVIVLDHLLRTATSEQLVPPLRAVAPHAKVLLISGMMPNDLERAAEAAEVDGFISKASSTHEICEAVRTVAQR